AELAAREAELSSLRLARGVALALPEPLLIVDGDGVIELANSAAEEFMGAQAVEGRHLAAALRAPAVFEAVETVERAKTAQTVDFTTSAGVERSCRAFVAPLDGGGARTLIFIRDL